MARTGKLGTVDSQLGTMQLAFAGPEAPRPMTGTKTGRLGTANSMLGSVRLAIGQQEGSQAGGIINASAENTVVLMQTVVCQMVRTRATASDLLLGQGLGLAKSVSAFAESPIALTDGVNATTGVWSYAVSANSALSLTDTAVRTSGTWLHEVTASSALDVMQAANGAIGTVIELAAGSTLALAQAAAATQDEWSRDLSAGSTLVLGQQATAALGNWVHHLGASNAISLTQVAIGAFIVDLLAGSTLAISQDASAGFVRVASASNSLTLSQEAVGLNAHVYDLTAESWLTELDQSVSSVNSLHRTAATTLALGQVLHVARPWCVFAGSVLQETHQEFIPGTIEVIEVTTGLTSSASANIVANRWARSAVVLGQTTNYSFMPPGGVLVSAGNALELGQDAWITHLGYAINTLTLGQVVAAQNGPGLGSQLALGQSAGVSVVRNRNVASALSLDQSVTYILVKHGAVDLAGYAPAGLPVLQGPFPGVTARFGLIYPADGPATDSIELRPPNLGNKDRLSFDRINRESRGGTLTVFADPNWPIVQTLALGFSGLRRTEAYELIRFVREHLGREIKLSDWEQRVWRGVITTPDEPVVQDGKDSFSASFEFEGDLLSM